MADRFDKFSEDARAALTLARDEARRLRHPYITTEHLLLALLRQSGSGAYWALRLLGVDPEEVFSTAEFIAGWGDTPVLGEIGLTPGAKQTIQHAVDEARRQYHEQISSEDLVLGLLRDGDSVAAGVLASFGVTLDAAREAVRRARAGEQPAVPAPAVPPKAPLLERLRLGAEALRRERDAALERQQYEYASALAERSARLHGMLVEVEKRQASAPMTEEEIAAFVLGKAGMPPKRSARQSPESQPHPATVSDLAARFPRFTDNALRALTFAQEEAQRFNHNYIGTEHLLLGLLRVEGSVAGRVLNVLGIESDRVRSPIRSIIGRGDRAVLGEIGLTPRAKKVFELAAGEVRRLNHGYIGTEHLLLGLVREGEGIAAGVLESLGMNLEGARDATRQVLGQQAGATTPSQSQGSDPMAELARMQAEMRDLQARGTDPDVRSSMRDRAATSLLATFVEAMVGNASRTKDIAIDAQLYELAVELRDHEVTLQDLLDRLRAGDIRSAPQSRGGAVSEGAAGEGVERRVLDTLEQAVRIAGQQGDRERAARLQEELRRLRDIIAEQRDDAATDFGRPPMHAVRQTPPADMQAQHEQDRQNVELALRLIERAVRRADELLQPQRAEALREVGARLTEIIRGLPHVPAAAMGEPGPAAFDPTMPRWYREARYGRPGQLAAAFLAAARENAALAGEDGFAAGLAEIQARLQALFDRAAQNDAPPADQPGT